MPLARTRLSSSVSVTKVQISGKIPKKTVRDAEPTIIIKRVMLLRVMLRSKLGGYKATGPIAV